MGVAWASLPSPSADETALANGQIDWFLTSEPLPLQIAHSGGGVVVADSERVVERLRRLRAGRGDRQGLRRSARGHCQEIHGRSAGGAVYLAAHVNDPSVVAVAEAALPGVPGAVAQASIAEAEYPLFADMSAQDWSKTSRFVDELGSLPDGAEITADDWTNAYLG